MNLLIVDTSLVTLTHLKRQLSKQIRTLEVAQNYTDARVQILSEEYDVVLVNYRLSSDPKDRQGLDLIREVRKLHNKTPIIMLAKENQKLVTSWEVLEAGGDDFIHKPFELWDLLARIKMVYRKSFHCSNNSTNRVKYESIELNFDTRKLTVKGREKDLGDKSLMLLSKFLKYPHKVYSSADLVSYLWGDHARYSSKSFTALRVYICNLKNLLQNPKYIRNRYGYGYVFDETYETFQ